jgi:integrase
MGSTKKSPKGEISIDNNKGRIRLRWRYQGKRYPLSLPYDYTPENMHHATVKVAEIKLDILKGCFDTSLERYKPKVIKPVTLLPVKAAPPITTILFLGDLSDKFKDWTKNIKNINIDHSVDYYGIYRILLKWVEIPLEKAAARIEAENWGVSTYNKRLNILSSFFNWLKNSGVIAQNPLLEVSRRRNKRKKKNERRIPLTEDEINNFLEAIRKDTYCHKFSPYKHSFYYPFFKFMFLTGVRNAEAIGLKVKHIDFEAEHIEISETLARTTKGSHHAARISKGTKTDNVRYIPLTEELKDMLLPLVQGKEPDSLVFPSPRGLSIDDRMLQRRIFKPVLKKMSIDDRDLYSARGAFGTRAVQQGMALTDLANLMGHATIETAIRNYVSVTRTAVSLPTINKKQ